MTYFYEVCNKDLRKQLGRRGEQLATRFLKRRLYRILDRNFHTRYGELDIVFRERQTLVFCEVKTRTGDSNSKVNPLESVGELKREQLRKIAAFWLARKAPRASFEAIRFDVIGVVIDRQTGRATLQHIKDAF